MMEIIIEIIRGRDKKKSWRMSGNDEWLFVQWPFVLEPNFPGLTPHTVVIRQLCIRLCFVISHRTTAVSVPAFPQPDSDLFF